ncbi:hypothetical protein [Streptomyces sp. NPDC048650]|uniref:hypothetical protein n=1 Tax=Streptomyces sp. NPDC048650 TaxID=3365583 RepID=UPI003711708E
MESVGTAGDEARDADEIVAELEGALGALGVVLPSLCVDPVSDASRTMQPLVELGRCNLGTARRLLEVLAGRRP